MNGTILDKIEEGSGMCYLTKIRLDDYINAIPADYQDYDVQREIVNNVYLDNLIQTVFEKKHIPPIVLIANGDNVIAEHTIQIGSFKILDGLQRTFRLKVIYDTVDLLKKEITTSRILEMRRLELSKYYKSQLESIKSSSVVLYKAVELYNKHIASDSNLLSTIFERHQWFEIWTNLTPEEEVNKMLILNAGHKPVKTKHQLELLFMTILPIIQQASGDSIQIVREKEVSSMAFSKGRELGQFHFSTLITSILSIAERKPLTTNVDLIQKKQADYFDDRIFEEYLQYHFLKAFVETLLSIDKNIAQEYGEIGIKWMGREISLVGMFAAIGKYAESYKLNPKDALEHLQKIIAQTPALLNLKDFENERNSLDLGKVNIGNVNKRAVFEGVYHLLENNKQVLNWQEYFKTERV